MRDERKDSESAFSSPDSLEFPCYFSRSLGLKASAVAARALSIQSEERLPDMGEIERI